MPLSHWLVVADLAIGRLGDKSALVRKAAMHLLAVMLGFNPFAPQLPSSAFASSLKEYEAKLAQMAPPPETRGGARDRCRRGTRNDAEETAAHGREDDADEGRGRSESVTRKKKTQEEATVRTTPDPPRTQPELDGGVEAVRTMVAALKTALGFAVQMGGAVRRAVSLLASSTPSDAIEADGSARASAASSASTARTRASARMLGLVFCQRYARCGTPPSRPWTCSSSPARTRPSAAAAGASPTSPPRARSASSPSLEEVIELLVRENGASRRERRR